MGQEMKTLRQKIVWHCITTGPTTARRIAEAVGADSFDVLIALEEMEDDGYEFFCLRKGVIVMLRGPGIESTYAEAQKAGKLDKFYAETIQTSTKQ